MKSKLIPIAYTVAVIKPNVAMKADKMEEVMKIIDENDFEVFHQKQKILKNEEILNLFYKYRNKDFYDDIKEHLTAGESQVLLLINKVETVYDEEKEEEVKLEDPITRWKKLIGLPDPEEAKTKNSNWLRALFGLDLIRNGFHGSDDPRSANKERDIFKFSIPEKIPEFRYERYKITMDHLLKFWYPPNLEHSNVAGRLDLLALYGPTVDYHSVDGCFCNKCIKISKDCLREAIAAHEAKERRERGGGSGTLIDPTGIDGSGMTSFASTKKTAKMTKNLGPGPRRLLKEEDVDIIRDDLCKKCREHVKSYIHLTCGREGQHIMSDIELSELIKEINKNDLYELLKIEKGSTAKIMIETIDLTEPEEIRYTEDDIRNLLSDLDTDYYDRFEFDDLQKMILEDRRLRINFWVSKITHKPIEKFKNPNMINQNSKVDRDDIKNPYFTLKRILPISLHTQKSKTMEEEDDINALHFDHTAKLLQNEQDLIMERTIAKEFHRVTGLEDTNSKDVAINAVLLRNYNDGRHGKWNNYWTLKGQNKGTYVKSKNMKKKDIIE